MKKIEGAEVGNANEVVALFFPGDLVEALTSCAIAPFSY
jgi:hypothetical protein